MAQIWSAPAGFKKLARGIKANQKRWNILNEYYNNNNLILIMRAFHEMIKRALHDFYL